MRTGKTGNTVKSAGKLISKAEVQRVASGKPKRGRPPKSEVKAARRQSIARVSRPSRNVPAKSKPAGRPHQPAISITVQIPSLRRSKEIAQNSTAKAAQPVARPKNRPRMWIALAAAVVVLAGGGGTVLLSTKKPVFKPGAAAGAQAKTRTTPTYQPLMLADQKATTQSYDGKRNMVSYTTTFSGVRITVSEQALPDNFAHDPAALLRAADGLNAKQRVDTARGMVFVATNETAGDQMGIFADKQVLGFIHTNQKMDDSFWKSFVEQLKPVDWQTSNQGMKS
jgi:hypothetical protein